MDKIITAFYYSLPLIALFLGSFHGEKHIGIICATMLFVGAIIYEQLTLIRKDIKNNFNKKS